MPDEEKLKQEQRSLSLTDEPARTATYKAVEYAKNIRNGHRGNGEALMIVADKNTLLILTSMGDVIEPDETLKEEVLNALKGSKTIIAVAHKLSTINQVDKIIYMFIISIGGK